MPNIRQLRCAVLIATCLFAAVTRLEAQGRFPSRFAMPTAKETSSADSLPIARRQTTCSTSSAIRWKDRCGKP
jgi:hypothetical protein